MHPRIIELPAFDLVGLEFQAARDGDIRTLWQRFLPLADGIAGRSEPQALYGLCTRDEHGALRYLAGAMRSAGEDTPGLLRIHVPAQKYAVFVHRGSVEQMPDSLQRIYGELLALRGLEPYQAPVLERYAERFRGPDDADSEVELYIPVY